MAREAGQLTLDFFRTDRYRVERKADNSPVTAADRDAESLLRERINAAFPHDAIVGEEYGRQDGSSGYRWILDPIDGTKSFISGVPLYGTLVGVEFDHRGILGVLYLPALDEMVFAAEGGGAWYCQGDVEPRAARVCSCPDLAQGLFVTSQIDSFGDRGADGVFLELQRRAAITRTWGDCYGYLLVATGRAAVMVDPELHVWDAAAVQPILQEAGGTFTDWKGTATVHHGEGIGTNGRVLEEVLAITRRYSKAS
jgi:histidinol phosphatase-like enzyme (inositol monophosphatase family)